MVNALAIRHLRQTSQPPSLSWLLVDCWRLDATDGRDKVFALLGMASDAQDSAFEPNYETTPEEIFHRSTVRLLTRDRLSNRVLHAAGVGFPRSLSALPSWVPDWTTHHPNTVFGAVAQSASYRASGDVSAPRDISYDRERDCVTLSGRIFDNVATVAEPFPRPIWHFGMKELKQKTAAEISWLEDLRTLWPGSKLHPSELPYCPDVLCRTLIANMVSPGIPAPSRYIDHFEEYVANHYRIMNATTEQWDAGVAPVESVYSAQQFATAMSLAADSRRVFATKHTYIGLGPLEIEKGDKICIFLGFNTPFIIRPYKAGGYILVGECYIYGLMDGEALYRGREEDVTLF
jgi:hypothetical protein